jgi:hypothetical protein
VRQRKTPGSLGSTSPDLAACMSEPAEKVENLGILAVQIRRSQQPRLSMIADFRLQIADFWAQSLQRTQNLRCPTQNPLASAFNRAKSANFAICSGQSAICNYF